MVVGAVLAVAARGTPVPTAAVPSLVNESRADAEALLASAGEVDGDDAAAATTGEGGELFAWDVSVRQEPSEAVEAGFVIRQDPDPGTELADGETVRFWVSLGPPLRIVPDLADRRADEVEAELAAAELAVGDVATVPDEVVEAGQVVTWRADGEERPAFLPKGTELDVVVSSGPASRTVPALAGSTVEQASAALADLGLEPDVTEEFSRTVDRGLVVSTEPPSGTSVERGATVEVVVSRGPDLVTVPDVDGLSEDEAISALESAGLVAGSSTGPAGGRVFDSDPGAGASVLRGTVVDLFRRR